MNGQRYCMHGSVQIQVPLSGVTILHDLQGLNSLILIDVWVNR